MLSIVRDVTERVRAATRLAAGLAAGQVGIWEWDLATGQGWASESAFELFGVPTEPGQSVDPLMARVHPEDLASLVAGHTAVRGTGRPATHEFRVVRPDGTTRWIEDRARVVPDARGEPVRLLGTLVDVTERRQSERERDVLARAE